MTADTSTEACATNLVDKESYRSARKEFVSLYIDFFLHQMKMKKSAHTLKTNFGQFNRFVRWCDSSFIQGFDSKDDFVAAVRLFTEYLIHNVRSSDMNVNTAASLQQVVLGVGRYVYGDPYGDLFRNVRKVRRSLQAVNKTKIPEDTSVARALTVYLQVFNQLSDFVVDFQKFPKEIVIENNRFWFFPVSVPFAGKSTVNKKAALKSRFLAYDYINGQIRSVEEIKRISKTNLIASHRASHNNAIRNMEVANYFRFHNRRIDAARMAFQAFVMLFSANTGMNLGQMLQLPWSGEHDTLRDRIGFKGIKYRAGNRDVVFHISSTFYLTFKKFLLLRQYILDALNIHSYPLLFFKVAFDQPAPLSMEVAGDLHRRLNVCFGFDLKITTRMWRAYKGDWLIRNTDVATTSLVLQNSPVTVLRHYSEGSKTRNDGQIGRFFDSYKAMVIDIHTKAKSTPVGQCIGSSPATFGDAPIEPDCRTFEGCLFCKNYKVHSDIEDVHKLISFKYLLKESLILAHTEKHFNEKVMPVLDRIDQVLDVIKSNFSGDIGQLDDIERDVFDKETLSDYWQMKLETLIEIGVLS
ncbi:hypothetical protein OW491_07580 [Neptunomonas sp. CHC150]|uniref:hypothetical protein n=1 Tax=Neptunomonas sp. CHC150 TaxID=2998324 RepID=UPI0025B219A7|nr:hypothetical protein [Neptunomonas sp. CHC150]MDN2659665.1 hypothetical protein [Neptunomonas sp. CHC150]